MSAQLPLLENSPYTDIKDPCPVFDGKIWHLFGSAGSSQVEQWQILHASAPTSSGPWTLHSPAQLSKLSGPHVAAPGVIFDEGRFHMFVQTDFMKTHGKIIYLSSKDGFKFDYGTTALKSLPKTPETGIYDPHPAIINGKKYLVYCGFKQVSHGDIFLAESTTNSWAGPWQRLGKILSHEEVPHHNQHHHPDYEWGLEGPQILELPDKMILLIAVCFLPSPARGRRQRVFFATSKSLLGPYQTLGPVLEPAARGWASGENGHAAGVIDHNKLVLFYQARSKGQTYNPWRYSVTDFNLPLH